MAMNCYLSTAAKRTSFVTMVTLHVNEGDYLLLPRGTMWRLELEPNLENPLTVLMIEATNASYGLPDKGLLGHHGDFRPRRVTIATNK